MEPIFRLAPDSPLAAGLTDGGGLVPLRAPGGWAVGHKQLTARRLPDGRCEANGSEDLFWARTAPPPWLAEVPPDEDVRRREPHLDAGWYAGTGFRLCLLAPDWDHVRSQHTATRPDGLVTTLETWMALVSRHGRLPRRCPPPGTGHTPP
ncbi:hypothetical protein [Marinitenerispora sediminis]|nr:hypothetical protein [Marinitenerispora sediminis]